MNITIITLILMCSMSHTRAVGNASLPPVTAQDVAQLIDALKTLDILNPEADDCANATLQCHTVLVGRQRCPLADFIAYCNKQGLLIYDSYGNVCTLVDSLAGRRVYAEPDEQISIFRQNLYPEVVITFDEGVGRKNSRCCGIIELLTACGKTVLFCLESMCSCCRG